MSLTITIKIKFHTLLTKNFVGELVNGVEEVDRVLFPEQIPDSQCVHVLPGAAHSTKRGVTDLASQPHSLQVFSAAVLGIGTGSTILGWKFSFIVEN